MEERKLYPFRFLPEEQERPWGVRTVKLADLGTVATMVGNGWFGGNLLSDLMQTYLERVVGDDVFQSYGTQFPVAVHFLDVRGRTALQVIWVQNPALQTPYGKAMSFMSSRWRFSRN